MSETFEEFLWTLKIQKISHSAQNLVFLSQNDSLTSSLVNPWDSLAVPSPEMIYLQFTKCVIFLFQARPKYLRCIAISCFYIAAKTLEEDEVSHHSALIL